MITILIIVTVVVLLLNSGHSTTHVRFYGHERTDKELLNGNA